MVKTCIFVKQINNCIMRKFTYITTGTCSKAINFELDENCRVHNVQFVGGCPGNTTGISRLVENQKSEDVIRLLKGIRCGNKTTSCPDQLALALEEKSTL